MLASHQTCRRSTPVVAKAMMIFIHLKPASHEPPSTTTKIPNLASPARCARSDTSHDCCFLKRVHCGGLEWNDRQGNEDFLERKPPVRNRGNSGKFGAGRWTLSPQKKKTKAGRVKRKMSPTSALTIFKFFLLIGVASCVVMRKSSFQQSESLRWARPSWTRRSIFCKGCNWSGNELPPATACAGVPLRLVTATTGTWLSDRHSKVVPFGVH